MRPRSPSNRQPGAFLDPIDAGQSKAVKLKGPARRARSARALSGVGKDGRRRHDRNKDAARDPRPKPRLTVAGPGRRSRARVPRQEKRIHDPGGSQPTTERPRRIASARGQRTERLESEFEPKAIDSASLRSARCGGQAQVTPPAKGDRRRLRANLQRRLAQGERLGRFRIAVATSALWGIGTAPAECLRTLLIVMAGRSQSSAGDEPHRHRGAGSHQALWRDPSIDHISFGRAQRRDLRGCSNGAGKTTTISDASA